MPRCQFMIFHKSVFCCHVIWIILREADTQFCLEPPWIMPGSREEFVSALIPVRMNVSCPQSAIKVQICIGANAVWSRTSGCNKPSSTFNSTLGALWGAPNARFSHSLAIHFQNSHLQCVNFRALTKKIKNKINTKFEYIVLKNKCSSHYIHMMHILFNAWKIDVFEKIYLIPQ